MEDLDEAESEGKALATHCLICAQEDNSKESEIGGLIEGPEESQHIFNLLCNSLKIKLNKKNSWDFKNELLPFCPSCWELSRELVEIQGQIHLLDAQYDEKVQEIRYLILGSEKPTALEDSEEINEADGRQSDHRFGYFRGQVTGTRTRGRKKMSRECRKKPLGIPPVPQIKLKKLTTLLEEPKKNRRSERVSKKVLAIIPDFHDSDSEEEKYEVDNEEVHESQNNEMMLDPLRNSEHSQAQEHMYINYDSPTPLDIKPLIDFKQEEWDPDLVEEPLMTVESEYEHGQTPNTLSLSILASTSKGNINKRTSKPTRSRIRLKKKQLKQVVVDDECDESEFKYDSDYRKETSEDSSTSDEQEADKSVNKRQKTGGTCKWKSCKTTGRFWYDGIEILPAADGLKCTECDEIVKGEKNWKNKSGIKRHVLSKHREKFACELCDKALSSQKYLTLHIQAIHEKSILIPCNICEKPFTSVIAMRRHSWSHQNDEEKQAAIAAGKKKYGSGSKNKGDILCTKCGKMCQDRVGVRPSEFYS